MKLLTVLDMFKSLQIHSPLGFLTQEADSYGLHQRVPLLFRLQLDFASGTHQQKREGGR